MTEELHILSGSAEIGRLRYDRRTDSLEWMYDSSWRDSPGAHPASVSLPLSQTRHGDSVVRAFLSGLLPDNPHVLEAWGKRFHVSPRNPFDLVKHVGEDCAGAFQFVRPERLGAVLSGELDRLIPLEGGALAERIRDLKLQANAVPVRIEGRFSLAGAQIKDALHLKDGKWFVPEGRIPSTHILKIPLEAFEHHTLNEYFCLLLARRLGLPTPRCGIIEVAGEPVIRIERYDRRTEPDGRATIG
jgi:serine/threonine-protein kinase HipA